MVSEFRFCLFVVFKLLYTNLGSPPAKPGRFFSPGLHGVATGRVTACIGQK